MSVEYRDRHVVVTGVTGELGAAVAARLVEAGATVHAPCRDASRARRLAERLGDSLRLVPGIDLGDEAAIAAFYRSLPAVWASVHAAGGFAAAPIGASSLEEFRRMIAINAETCFLCCREAVAAMRRTEVADAEGRGRIVNVAAEAALDLRRGAGKIAYAASKSAVAAITVGLADELAPEGIWVNAVVPSIMDTPANRAAMPGADPTRWPTPADVAETIAFLASPRNRVGRGALVPVYGRS